MTGLKSGSGDDLWGEETDETEEGNESAGENDHPTESGTDTAQSADRAEDNQTEKTRDESTETTTSADEESSASSPADESSSHQQPYIVRRAVQNKSVQFERDERLTFFVHDDVVVGERDLITDVESELGRSVPKFDVREAVYRAALRNRDDILEELLKMGYSTDDA